MRMLIILVLVFLAISFAIVLFVAIREVVMDYKNGRPINWGIILLAPILFPFGFIYLFCEETKDYICDVWEDGGFVSHYRLKKYRKAKEEVIRRKREKESAEYERFKNAYLSGEIKRTELPRVEDGVKSFEFSPEMGLYVMSHYDVREIVYVENEYNERLNRFFQEHKDLRLYHMYKFVYLPNLCKELEDGELFHYLYPDAKPDDTERLSISSSYPLQYLVYSEDVPKIKQGMFFFNRDSFNHGALYIQGDYHPLNEGSDEEIIAQLDEIVKAVNDKHGKGGLFCKAERPDTKEGSSDDYADEMFYWETINPEIAKLMAEVRERLDKILEYGLAENILMNLLKKKQKPSRLVITHDYRIILPDYNNMEIKMEPLVKAVYLLFLKHPEGIIFKCLPDYRKELADIYQMIKPLGLNEKAIQSIEDVTNPLLNSINEKCARIRGAFISKFDDSLAQHYYIYGMRGEPKNISLPRDLVIWE